MMKLLDRIRRVLQKMARPLPFVRRLEEWRMKRKAKEFKLNTKDPDNIGVKLSFWAEADL